MNLYETLKKQIAELLESARQKMADGRLTLSELGTLCREILQAAVVLAEKTDVAGPLKRQIVKDLAMRLYLEHGEPLLRNYLSGFVGKLALARIRQMLPGLLDLLIDELVQRFNRVSGQSWLTDREFGPPGRDYPGA